jgi:hypothetical protein
MGTAPVEVFSWNRKGSPAAAKLGHRRAQKLVLAGERVLDVRPED